jgi:hypothetical protein
MRRDTNKQIRQEQANQFSQISWWIFEKKTTVQLGLLVPGGGHRGIEDS